MKATLTATQRTVFAEVWKRRSAGGATLKALAGATKLAPPSALAQLRKLVALQLIDRNEARPGAPTYVPRPYFEATLVNPVEGLVDSWKVNDLPDWRFPLVSRVPDAPARASLNRLLDLAWERRWIPGKPGAGKSRGGFRGITFVVYGSCAEGTARAGSDVDLVGILGPQARAADDLRDLVAEVNVEVERKIDGRFLTANEFLALPEALRLDLRKGKTVYRSSEDSPFVEALS